MPGKTMLELYNELIGLAGESLDPDYAKTLIQRANWDILNARLWSFNVAEGVLKVPEQVSTGTVTVTQFLTTVTADATAKTALDASENINIPLSGRQFRVGSGRIYNISSYDTGTGVITLEDMYTETSATGTSYAVFQCYYAPPSADFLRFTSVVDLEGGTPLRLDVQKRELDKRDPQRTSVESPMAVVSYKAAADGSPLFELWPRPTTASAYMALYQRRGVVLEADGDTLPPSIPDELLMARAQYHLAKWAEMAKGRDPGLRATNWTFLIGESLARYTELLHRARLNDDEIFNTSVSFPRERMYGPPSASWMQSHDF